MSVIVNMACGLANRMFQYAFYLRLQKDGYDVYVDYFTTAGLAHESVDWFRIFPHAVFRQASVNDVKRMGGGHGLLSKIRRKYFSSTTNVMEMKGAFDAVFPSLNKDTYMLGVFQNAEIVESVSSDIHKAFVFPEFESEKNRSLQQCMAQENSVAIHVRKGTDYQKRIWYQNTCGVEYYKKAVEQMTEKVSNPHFYVFTDNPVWIRENMSWLDYRLVEGNPASGWGSHCDMQLMSLCKHNIISNSTYSWWSAFLNTNMNKIVIGPKIWFNPQSCDEYVSDRTMCKDWILI